jgi:hypothetical protein
MNNLRKATCKPWIAMTAAHAVDVRQAMYVDILSDWNRCIQRKGGTGDEARAAAQTLLKLMVS